MTFEPLRRWPSPPPPVTAMRSVAPESIVATFGINLASGTGQATQQPLPTSLGGVTVTVRDSTGVERPAPLLLRLTRADQFPDTFRSWAGRRAWSSRSLMARSPVGAPFVSIRPRRLSSPPTAVAAALPAAALLRYRGNQLVAVEPVYDYDSVRRVFVGRPIDPWTSR
jgi:hypothetical protein